MRILFAPEAMILSPATLAVMYYQVGLSSPAGEPIVDPATNHGADRL
jgi:hypothetical protein